MLSKLLAIFGAVITCTATSCLAVSEYALTPRPELSADSARVLARPVVARVAAQFGLQAWGSQNDSVQPPPCYFRETLILCESVTAGEFRLQFRQARTTKFSPWADSVRNAVVDSLRHQFGSFTVLQRR